MKLQFDKISHSKLHSFMPGIAFHPAWIFILLTKPVLPNLFSTTAHFLGTAHQTAHCIYDTYFI